MEIASIRKHEDKLSPTQASELQEKFLRSAKCGVELEGQSNKIPQAQRMCNYDRTHCGICAPHSGTCPQCIACVRKTSDSTCKLWSHEICYVRTCQVDGERKLSASEKREACTGCNLCRYCQRDCSGCVVCETCTAPNRGLRNEEESWSAVKKVAKDAKCPTSKTYDTEKLDGESDFMYCYNDGSVNTELVTKPFQLYQLEPVLTKGIDIMLKHGCNLTGMARAGAHQTFSYDGLFKDIIARNIVQMMRYYLPALLTLCVDKGTSNRGHYRTLPDNPGWGAKCESFNPKYEAIHVKSHLALEYQPRMIEFRYPDMSPYPRQHMLMALFNAAVILKSIELSQKGVVSFHNYHWEYVKSSTELIYREESFDDGVIDLRTEMINYLTPMFCMLVGNAYDIIETIHNWKPMPQKKQIDTLPNFRWVYNRPYNKPPLEADSIERPTIEWLADGDNAAPLGDIEIQSEPIPVVGSTSGDRETITVRGRATGGITADWGLGDTHISAANVDAAGEEVLLEAETGIQQMEDAHHEGIAQENREWEWRR